MNKDRIIELVREAGFTEPTHPFNPWSVNDDTLERFVALVEREVRGDAEKDVIRYRWLKENSAKFSWNPSRYNERMVDGFAAFGTRYLGYNFEQAVDLAMEAALATAKEAGL